MVDKSVRLYTNGTLSNALGALGAFVLALKHCLERRLHAQNSGYQKVLFLPARELVNRILDRSPPSVFRGKTGPHRHRVLLLYTKDGCDYRSG